MKDKKLAVFLSFNTACGLRNLAVETKEKTMAIRTNNNTHYYINPAYLTFNENSGYGANLIQVSASSSCYIRAFIPGVIKYDADGNYRRWKVTAYNNKFPDNTPDQRGKWFIYVRMERDGMSSLIIYDQVERGIHGAQMVEKTDDEGNVVRVEGEYDEDSFPYYYVLIGEVGPISDINTGVREISYDTGRLESDQVKTEGTQVNEMWELDKFSVPWLIRAKQWLAGFTVKGFINLIGGLIFNNGKEEKAVLDIKRSTDDDKEVPVNDTTIPTTLFVKESIEGMDGKFLRKDKDDRSVGRISTDEGFEAGRFVSDFLGGTGAWIGADGYGEMSGLTLREFLEVPELRFNRIDVVSGELWNAVAFGMVEEVDTKNRICKIKLEENERCGLHLGDFCRGIFADFGDGNNWEGEDECGFMHLYGFWTSYFTPTKILDNEEGLFRFEYELKPDTAQHPTQSMKFAVYGHPTDKSRQASAYATRTYKRYLNNVDTWVIDPDRHIYAQYGELNGLQINGVKMQGYGSFQSNAYFRGVQIQLPPEQMESLKGDSAYAAQLTSYVGTVKLDADGNMSGGMFEELNVVADGKNVICRDIEQPQTFRNVTTKNYRLTTTVQAYKGTTPLYYSAGAVTKGSFTLALACVGCTASVVNGAVIINSITDTKDCRINITVNCEGMAVYNLEYNVAFVKDGENGVAYELSPSNVVIKQTTTGSIEPEQVLFKLKKRVGNTTKDAVAKWLVYGKKEGEEKVELKVFYSTALNYNFASNVADGYKYFTVEAVYNDGLGSITSSVVVVKDGENGQNVSMYEISPGTNIIKETSSGVEPSTISFTSWKREGGSRIKFTARWIVFGWKDSKVGQGTILNDLNTWSNSYTYDFTDRVKEGYKYFEVKTDDGTFELATSEIVLVKDGEKGENGESYDIVPNVATISKTMTGSLDPESVTFRLVRGGSDEGLAADWSVYRSNTNEGLDDGFHVGSAEVGITDYYYTFSSQYKYYMIQARLTNDTSKSFRKYITVVSDGENGASGAMPRYRGEFVFNNESEPYVYDGEYRDIVIYEGNVYQVYMYGSSIIEPPSIAPNADNDGKWQRANKFRFVAMDTALIDSANIGGFMFKRTKYIDSVPVGRLESQYGPVVIREVSEDSGVIVPVTIRVTSGNGITTLTSQIIKTKGDYAYALKPTTRLVTLDKDNNPSVSVVSCSLIRKSVSGESSITSVPTGYTLKYSVAGGTETAYTPNTSITVPKTNGSTIVFRLRDNQSNIVSEEVVYVFSEASTQGTILYDRYIQFACNDDGSVKFGLPYRFRVSQWQGGKEVPLTNITLSGNYVTIDNERIELDAESGTLKCTNVDLTGTINAVAGNIGDWNIENGELVVSGIGDFESLRDTSYTNRIDMSGLHVDYGNGGIFADIGINYITFNAENHQYFSAINLRNMQGGSRRSDDMCGIYVSGSDPDIGILVEGCASSHLRSSIGTHIWGLTLNQRIVTSTGVMNPNDDVILFNNTSDIEFTFSGKASVGKVVFMKRGNNSTGSVKLKGAIRVCNSQTGTTSTERTLGTWSAMYVKTDAYWTEFYCG